MTIDEIWRRLGIEPTADARAIKRAYAVELKKTRPDEAPEAFQRLHEAYRLALAEAEREPMLSGAATHAEPYRQQETDESIPAELVTAATSPPGVAELERMMRRLDELIADDHCRREVDNWRFLEADQLLFDRTFCWELGLRVFERLAREERVWHAPSRNAILDYLDSLFCWRDNEEALRMTLGDDTCNGLLSLMRRETWDDPLRALSHVRGSAGIAPEIKYLIDSYTATITQRALAMLVDLALVAAWVAAMIASAGVRLQPVDSWFVLMLFCIASWLFQISPLQATPGMLLFGLKIMRGDARRLDLWRGFYLNLGIGLCAAVLVEFVIRFDAAMGFFLNDALTTRPLIGLMLFIPLIAARGLWSLAMENKDDRKVVDMRWLRRDAQ